MKVNGSFLTGAVAAAMLMLSAPAHAQTDPTGVWIDHTGRGAVEITPCGDALCGRVVWLKDTGNGEACGVQILGDVKPTGPGVWDRGWIYDPEQDSKFSVELKPQPGEKLRVLGYMGTKLFSETMIWTRAPADLAKCSAGDQTAAKPAAPAAQQPAERAPAPQAAAPAPQTRDEPAGNTAQAPAAPEEAKAAPPVADAKPRGNKQANAQSRNCAVDLPWVYVSFPCPD